MQDSAKYLIHADIRASGVVERSDVVGAIFGQTEGLLGEELDLRDLQESSKVGRIDVQIESEGGRSFGTVTIASGLDKVETAVLAAGLETIDRVGPCRSEFEVTDLEDAREAKRRTVVERATDLLTEFEESTLSSHELVEEVRQNVRVEHITEFEGLPAGPRVADSDAIIVVEGRADVLTLLQYGIKTAIAVEGTDVPDSVAELTHSKTVTAFLDGDRGGDLILKELAQVGDVDYVTFAPDGRSVEDLSRSDVFSALRKKALYDEVADHPSPHEYLSPGEPTPADDSPDDGPESDDADTVAAVATSTTAGPSGSQSSGPDADGQVTSAVEAVSADDGAATAESTPTASADDEPSAENAGADTDTGAVPEPTPADESDEEADTADDAADEADGPPETLAGHVQAVVTERADRIRLLDEALAILEDAPADAAFTTLETADTVPETVVLDGALSQRILDVAAQRGVGQIIAADIGEFVKQPTNVRVRPASDF
jgi:DNA primase